MLYTSGMVPRGGGQAGGQGGGSIAYAVTSGRVVKDLGFEHGFAAATPAS